MSTKYIDCSGTRLAYTAMVSTFTRDITRRFTAPAMHETSTHKPVSGLAHPLTKLHLLCCRLVVVTILSARTESRDNIRERKQATVPLMLQGKQWHVFPFEDSTYTVGTHPLISRYLKGVFQLRTPTPRYMAVYGMFRWC